MFERRCQQARPLFLREFSGTAGVFPAFGPRRPPAAVPAGSD
jgi:hypothetical protein